MPCAVCCPGGTAAVKRGSKSLKWAKCAQNLIRPRLLSYDGENRQVSVTNTGTGAVTAYSYDGDGHRVTKTTGGNTTLYIYSGAGELAAEYSTEAQTPLCNTCFLAVDHLGSTRMVMDESGAVKARHDYFPWGEELLTASRTGALGYQANDGVSQKFTGKERDGETGLGRFTSPDPLVIHADRLAEPQRLNLYVYARGNPLRYVDPNGLDDITYDQAGNEIDRNTRHGFWWHLFNDDTYRLRADNGHTYSLNASLDKLSGGQRYSIVDAGTTSGLISGFEQCHSNPDPSSTVSLLQTVQLSRSGGQ